MSVALPVEPLCPSCSTTTTAVPGPAGPAGTNGTNGTNGINAFTTLTAQFTMPGYAASDTADVAVSSWATVGQIVFLKTLGHFQVTAVPTSTSITLLNLKPVVGSSIYGSNANPGTIATVGQQLTPAGLQGIQGLAGSSGSVSPTTTRGDLIVNDGGGAGSDEALHTGGAGNNGLTIHADSTTGLGVKWAKVNLASASEVTGLLPSSNLDTVQISQGGTGQVTQQTAINALLTTGGASQGAIYKYDGANWVVFNKGTSKQVLRVNVAGTDLEWVSNPGSVQFAYSTVIGAASVVSVLPIITTPTSAQGVEIATVSITPGSASSVLRVQAWVQASPVGAGTLPTMALFRDATVNAIAAAAASGTAGDYVVLSLDYVVVAGSTSATTFKLRAGSPLGGQVDLNSWFGGLSASRLVVTEYLP